MRGLVKTGPRTQCSTETGFFFKKMFRTKTRSDWEVMDQLLAGFTLPLVTGLTGPAR
jgi:hypothetical protein